jgi:hypothetical protein
MLILERAVMTDLGLRPPLAVFAARMTMPRALGLPLQYWRRLRATIFDSYRPELHYMRGPGPKWRAKHAAKRVM